MQRGACARVRVTCTGIVMSEVLRARRLTSLLPRIWLVDAVGIGASSSELRSPCCLISAFSASQSHRPESGFTDHMSNCRMPLDAGEPS